MAGLSIGRSVLITGAGGFIGSAVTRRLVHWAEAGGAFWDGERLERICALVRPQSSDWRLEDVRESPVLSVERADIIDAAGLREVFRRYEPKAVLHLAFDPSGFDLQSDEEWRTRHLRPIETMFEEISRFKDPRFVHTGSAWVLGSGEKLAEDAVVAPILDYAIAKARLDEALGELSRAHGVPFVNLRLFNVFGRYEDRKRLLPHLVNRWRRGLPAQLTHGEQVRDFNDVDDIAEAYRLALLAPPSACGTIYHIGSGRGVSVREFAAMAAEALESVGDVEFDRVDTRDRNIPALVSDPGLAIKQLGWRPPDDLQVRIRDAVKWWLARPSGPEEDMTPAVSGEK